jgi:hypothetical protein
LRDFGVGEVLEVAHEDNLLILLVESFERGEEAALELVPGGGGGRCEIRVGELGESVERGVAGVKGRGEG